MGWAVFTRNRPGSVFLQGLPFDRMVDQIARRIPGGRGGGMMPIPVGMGGEGGGGGGVEEQAGAEGAAEGAAGGDAMSPAAAAATGGDTVGGEVMVCFSVPFLTLTQDWNLPVGAEGRGCGCALGGVSSLSCKILSRKQRPTPKSMGVRGGILWTARHGGLLACTCYSMVTSFPRVEIGATERGSVPSLANLFCVVTCREESATGACGKEKPPTGLAARPKAK